MFLVVLAFRSKIKSFMLTVSFRFTIERLFQYFICRCDCYYAASTLSY